jgi:hypothetical protein
MSEVEVAEVDVGAVVAELLQTTCRIYFSAIDGALTPEERKRHIEEGLCFKCHKKGHCLFQCPELKGKEAMGAPSKKQ